MMDDGQQEKWCLGLVHGNERTKALIGEKNE